MSLSLNLFLCIDLILTLKEPFYPAKRRTKWYIFFSVFIAVLISFLGSRRLDGACGNTGDLGENDLALSSTFLAIALSVYIMTALFSIIFAARMLSRPGVSSEIKGMYFRKHVLYVIVFIIVWSFTLATAYYNLYHSGETTSPNSVRYYERETGRFEPGPVSQTNSIRRTTVEKVSFIASILTGFFMALIRLMEPYFMFLLRKTWKGWFGIVLDEKELSKEGKITDTVAAFLNSSLNIELVHVILKVITEYCTRTSVGDDWRKNVVQKSYFKEKATHKIREIEIKDPDKWAIDKAAMERDFPGENTAPKGGEEDVTIINEEIEVLEHAPKIFSFIRSMDNINQEMIENSLAPELNRDQAFSAGESQGKSGSFFFFCHDKNFIIKTMNEDELKAFNRLFERYFRHLSEHPNSLLARIYGVFTVKIEKLKPVHLILMGNSMHIDDTKTIEHVFDLKGSIANREVQGKNLKNTSTLKDLNLLKLCQEKNLLKFSKEDRKAIMDIMAQDVDLLAEANIMDYSLLFCI